MEAHIAGYRPQMYTIVICDLLVGSVSLEVPPLLHGSLVIFVPWSLS